MASYRRTALLASAVVLLLMLGAAPAVAGKPGAKPGTPPPPCADVTTLTGPASFDLLCTWTPKPTADLGTIQVEVEQGALTRLLIMVRDYAPGDYCPLTLDPPIPGWEDPWAIWEGRFEAPSTLKATFPLVSEKGSYFRDPVNWCGTVFNDQDQPLWIRFAGRKTKGTVLTITLDPPQS